MTCSLHDLQSSPNLIGMKFYLSDKDGIREMHVKLGRPRRSWENNIKTDFRETLCGEDGHLCEIRVSQRCCGPG